MPNLRQRWASIPFDFKVSLILTPLLFGLAFLLGFTRGGDVLNGPAAPTADNGTQIAGQSLTPPTTSPPSTGASTGAGGLASGSSSRPAVIAFEIIETIETSSPESNLPDDNQYSMPGGDESTPLPNESEKPGKSGQSNGKSNGGCRGNSAKNHPDKVCSDD